MFTETSFKAAVATLAPKIIDLIFAGAIGAGGIGAVINVGNAPWTAKSRLAFASGRANTVDTSAAIGAKKRFAVVDVAFAQSTVKAGQTFADNNRRLVFAAKRILTRLIRALIHCVFTQGARKTQGTFANEGIEPILADSAIVAWFPSAIICINIAAGTFEALFAQAGKRAIQVAAGATI